MGAPRGSLLAPPPPAVPSPAPLPPWSCFRRAPPAPVSPERQRPASPDEAPAPLRTGSFAPLRPGPQCVPSPSGGAGPACEAGVAGTGAGGLGCGVRAQGPERGQIGSQSRGGGLGCRCGMQTAEEHAGPGPQLPLVLEATRRRGPRRAWTPGRAGSPRWRRPSPLRSVDAAAQVDVRVATAVCRRRARRLPRQPTQSPVSARGRDGVVPNVQETRPRRGGARLTV